jgi:hypothetical protein
MHRILVPGMQEVYAQGFRMLLSLPSQVMYMREAGLTFAGANHHGDTDTQANGQCHKQKQGTACYSPACASAAARHHTTTPAAFRPWEVVDVYGNACARCSLHA